MKEQTIQGNARQYMAFISYSHSDNREEGRKWADWLHTTLETYEIPEELIGEKNSRGEEIPRQIYPVFQDEKELSASASLSDSLKGSIDRTENLVLLCSPRSAKSIYVQDEVRYFKQTGRSKNIIALILSGEPQSTANETEIQCFPKALRYAVNSDGEILTDQPEEPIAADVRTEDGNEGYTSPEAYRRSLLNKNLSKTEVQARVNAYKDKLDLARLKIISGILKVPLGELTKRDKAYELKKMKARNRNIKRVATAIGVLAIAAVILGIMAWLQKNKAEATLARSLYQTGVNRIAAQDIANGAAYISAAARMGNSNAVMYAQSLLTNQSTEVKLPNLQYTSNLQYSPQGRYLIYVADNGVTEGRLNVWDAITLKPFKTLEEQKFSTFLKPQFSNEHTVYALNKNGNIVSWDFEKNITSPVTNFDSTMFITNFVLAPGGRVAYLNLGGKNAAFYNVETKSFLSAPAALTGGSYNNVVFSPAGDYAVEYITNTSNVKLSSFSNNSIAGKILRLDSSVTDAKFNSRGDQLALYSMRKIFLLKPGTAVAPHVINTSNNITDVFFNPDGKSIVTKGTFSYDAYSTDNGSHLKTIPANRFFDNLFREVKDASPDQTQVARVADNEVFIQNVTSVPMLKSQILLDTTLVKAISSYSSEKVYVLNKDSNQLNVYNLFTGAQMSSAFKMPSKIASFGLDKKSGMLYTVSGPGSVSNQLTVKFWDEATGKQTGKDISLIKQGYNFIISPDGKSFAARVNEKAIGIYDISTGKPSKQFTSKKEIKNYLISDELGYAIILAPDQSWQVVNVSGNKILKEEKTPGKSVMAAGFSAGEKKAAIRMSDGTVTVYNVPDMSVALSFPSQSTNDGVLKFSPDGNTLAASDNVNNIKLWDVNNKTAFGQTIKSDNDIRNFEWSADGKIIYVIFNESTGNIFTYDAANGYPATQAFGSGMVLGSQIVENNNSIMTLSSANNNLLLNFWEIPGQMNLSNNQLASDLELLFGRQYNLNTGAISTVKDSVRDNSRWYFQDPYVRKTTPGAQLAIIESIKEHVPVKSIADINFLTASNRHPLTRVAIAEYYSKDPYTAFVSDYLLQLTNYQLPRIKDEKLKAEVSQIMNNNGQLNK